MLRIVLRSAFDILLRTAGFIGIYLVFAELVDLPDDDGLGTGLLAFATFGLVALCWGGLDGWLMSFGRLAVAWPVVATLTGLAMSLLIWLPSDGSSTDLVGDIVSDFVISLPVIFGIIAVPALFTGAMMYSIKPRPQAQPGVTPQPSVLPR